MATVLDPKEHPIVDGLRNLYTEVDPLLEDAVTVASFALDGVDAAAEAVLADIARRVGVLSFALALRAQDLIGCLLHSGAFAIVADLNTVVREVLRYASVGLRKIKRDPNADVAAADFANAEGSSVGGREVRLLVFLKHVLVEREKAFVLLKNLLVTLAGHRLVELTFGPTALEHAPDRLGE